jgi:hypothetical protein
MNYVAPRAYSQIAGDDHSFYDAWLARRRALTEIDNRQDMGEDFDFDDEHEMRLRLPRLTDRILGPARPAVPEP